MPESKIDLGKLREAIDYSVQVNEVFRVNMVEHVREYIGSDWQDITKPNKDNENPINLLAMYVTVINRRLVGNEPRMMASTFDRDMRSWVQTFEDDTNRKLDKMRFVDILRRAVLDATFLMGITKTSIVSPIEARIGGYSKTTGKVGISSILFENYLFDPYAACFDECEWKGHCYEADYDEVKESKLFKKKVRIAVQEQEDTIFDKQGNQKLSTLARDRSEHQEYRKKVTLCEIWLRKENKVVTFDANGDMDEPLMEQDWVGPESGPYDELLFGEVPGNLMPKAPAPGLVCLHREQNKLWKKLGNQASNQKTNILYSDAADAEAHKKAKDQDYIRSNSPQGLKEVSTGGPHNMVQAFSMLGYNMFNDMAGNIKAVAGLGRQADTLGQEKMIVENASAQILALSQRATAFTHRLMNKLGWFFWHNPHESMTSSYSVPGLPQFQTERKVTPQERSKKRFEDIDIRLDPYSLQYLSPQDKASIIEGFTKEVFIPLAPLFNKPGISDFMQAYVKKVAKFRNMPELIELMEVLVGVQEMPQGEQDDGGGEAPGMNPETTRNYNRVSTSPGQSDQGESQQMIQNLMGGEMGNPMGKVG